MEEKEISGETSWQHYPHRYRCVVRKGHGFHASMANVLMHHASTSNKPGIIVGENIVEPPVPKTIFVCCMRKIRRLVCLIHCKRNGLGIGGVQRHKPLCLFAEIISLKILAYAL